MCTFLETYNLPNLNNEKIDNLNRPTHSNILVWRILWMEEPGGLLSIGSHRVRHDWGDLACMHALEKEMAAHSSILAWRIPGTEEPGGLLSMGSHRVGHDWSDLTAAAANRPIRSKDTESVIKFFNEKSSGPDGFTDEFSQTVKEELVAPFSDSSKKLEKATLSDSFFQSSITLIPKPDKDITRKGQYVWWI